jgi:hypothetical protein
MSLDGKPFDRRAYSPRTMSMYRVISAYYVDVYYNHLYDRAIKLKNENPSIGTVTEGYRHAINGFMTSLTPGSASYKAELYIRMLSSLTNFFASNSKLTTVTPRELINKIAAEFVPTDYIENLSGDQKSGVVRSVLTDSIYDFTMQIAERYLEPIISDHNNRENVELLKEVMIDILIAHRVAKYRSFIVGVNDNKTGNMRSLVQKIQSDMRLVLAERDKLLVENKKMVAIIRKRYAEYTSAMSRIASLESQLDAAQSKMKTLEAEIGNVEDDVEYEERMRAISGASAGASGAPGMNGTHGTHGSTIHGSTPSMMPSAPPNVASTPSAPPQAGSSTQSSQASQVNQSGQQAPRTKPPRNVRVIEPDEADDTDAKVRRRTKRVEPKVAEPKVTEPKVVDPFEAMVETAAIIPSYEIDDAPDTTLEDL